ncbi:DUF924 family protein [Rubrivivax albus]|uniref:DUF924 domain-containing protein n=1 Tax=Rubrivivax albus TaxID=2499835 RepID=A0A3S2VYA3_9BURK|nr:DUF924 family protein [Rubrivivax albus]RVT52619.1 DUF924 domain-containing protein [Rubrivivax albus]
MTPADTEVLAFWFGAPPLAVRAEWFRKDPAFDEAIRARFGALVDDAIDGRLPALDPSAGPDAVLARLMLLDQFPRNLFRGQARAFAGDPLARTLALSLIDSGAEHALHPLQRWFVYLPLEHAEDLALQDRSVALFAALAAEAPGFDSALDYAERHRDVIRRFGRFPHRNAALGRVSTADEEAYLATPGSGF